MGLVSFLEGNVEFGGLKPRERQDPVTFPCQRSRRKDGEPEFGVWPWKCRGDRAASQ